MSGRAKLFVQVGSSLAVALLALEGTARAQAFQGTGTVSYGSATVNSSLPGSSTVILNSPKATINWSTNDSSASPDPFVFLPAGSAATFQGSSILQGGSYTVLNRILPNSPKAIRFDGSINSDPAGHIWFYSPGGIIVGPTARFNIGSLLLTSADPAIDQTGDFMPVAGRFGLGGAAGSQSAVEIQAGAQINAVAPGQSNYVVALAPRIQQDGLIKVGGSAALVAAESATFAIDQTGLFTISVDAFSSGTTVAGVDALSHGGSTIGPDPGATGLVQRVYLMAVPKNAAITMAIKSGGSLGFDVATAASIDGTAIVLSGGRNIADTGSGNPITGPSVGTAPVALAMGYGQYRSGVWASATGSIDIGDTCACTVADMVYSGQLFASAQSVTMNLAHGSNAVHGNLLLDASGDLQRLAGAATLALYGAGTTLTVDGHIDVLAQDGPAGTNRVNGTTLISPAAASPYGGSAYVSAVNGAALSAVGNISVDSNALSLTSGTYPAYSPTTAGFASVSALDGGQIRSTGGTVIATANAYGLLAPDTYQSSAAIDASGGQVTVQALGPQSLVSGALGLIAQASAIGGVDHLYGAGGRAIAGSAAVIGSAGGQVVAGQTFSVAANATGGNALLSGATGGYAIAGHAQVYASDGSVIGQNGARIEVAAYAIGGTSGASGNGGNAFAGQASVQTGSSLGMIDAPGGIAVVADALGGDGSGGQWGGSARGGTATLATTGAGQSIGSTGSGPLTVSAKARAGAANGGHAGDAVGGAALVNAFGGSVTGTSVTIDVSAQGDATSTASGTVAGGSAGISVHEGGSFAASGNAVLAASAVSSVNITAGDGSLHGGSIAIQGFGSRLGLAGSTTLSTGISITGAVAPADLQAGSIRVESGYASTTYLGAPAAIPGDLDLANVTLTGSGQSIFLATGSINVATAGLTGTADGVKLALIADWDGSGSGTVNLASGAVALTGPGSTVDIFYNPVTFGSPTDYTSGTTSGSWTGYQLVNALDKLQSINGFLTQNFALSRSLDAGQTAAWNEGLGFVPLGTDGSGAVLNGGNGFTGRFIGLGHVVSGLHIDRPTSNYVGLFGYAGAGSEIGLVGLLDGAVHGASYTGALVGRSLGQVSKTYSSTPVVGSINTGGLVGGLDGSGLVNASFVTASVDGLDNSGGLIGLNRGTVFQTYATGHVNGQTNVGGLIGSSDTGTGPNSVSLSYATGDVQGSSVVGGLIGRSVGAVSESYASGLVSGANTLGGLFGSATGTFTTLYWDSASSGQVNPAGSISGSVNSIGSVSSNPDALSGANSAFGLGGYAGFSGANWISFNNQTRPVGDWESPGGLLGDRIYSIHQLQFLLVSPGRGYELAANIDASETGRSAGIWGSPGFIPIGQSSAMSEPGGGGFTGSLDGAGKVISDLSITPTFSQYTGLFSINQGHIRNLGLVNATVAGSGYYTGAIAGLNQGSILGSFVTGTVSGQDYVGGLVGNNEFYGLISQSYATGSVSAYSYTQIPTAGGIVGFNLGRIEQTYARVAVGSPSADAYLGGLVGASYQGQPISSSYWDTVAGTVPLGCGLDFGGSCAQVTGLSPSQMTSAANYADWTIDSTGGQQQVWRIYEGNTAPLLKAFLRPATVNVQDTTLTYSDTVPTVRPILFAGTDQQHLFGTGQVSGAGRNVGRYTLTYAGGFYSDQLGYDLIAGPSANLTITPAALTLAAVSDRRSYNATTASSLIPLISGLQGSDSVSGLVQAFDSANAGARTLAVKSGYSISDGNGGNNYAVTLNTAAGQIDPAALVLSAVPDSRSYDATTASSLTPTASGLQGSDTVSGLAQAFDSANAGTRTLAVKSGYSISDGNGGNNYAVTLTTAAGSIAQAALTLSALPDSKLYDATTVSSLTPTISGLHGSDSVSGLAQAFDSANSGARTLAVKSGYTISDGNGGNNYAVTLTTAAGRIDPAALTVTAGNATKTYDGGGYSGGNGVTYSAFVAGEDASVLGGALTYAGTSQGARNVGSYTITPGGLVSANYTIAYIDGALTITPAALTLAAVSDRRSYNATTASSLIPLISGLQGSDSVSGLVQAFDSANAGARTLAVKSGYSISDGNGGNNYAVTLNTAAGQIDPAALVLSAVPDSRSYDATTASSLTPTASGLQGSDTVSGLAQAFDSANAGTRTLAVKSGYSISDGNGGNNYAVTLTTAAGSIAQAALTLSALPDSKLYDATTVSSLTPTISGLHGSDSVSGLAQAFDSANSGARTLAVKSGYTISDGNGGNNYAVTLTTAAGRIDPAALTIAAIPDRKTYDGDALSTLVPTVTGLQGIDTVSALGQAFDSANAGNRVLVVRSGYIVNDGNLGGNYRVTQSSASGAIDPAAVSVFYTATPAASRYGDAPAQLGGTVSSTPLIGTDTLAGITSGTATFVTSVGSTSPVGSYAVIGSGLASGNGNYQINFVQSSGNAIAYQVTPRPITVNAALQSRTYGDPNPVLTYTIAGGGLVNGDQLTGSQTTTASQASGTGSYEITQGALAASSNYTLSYNPGTITVIRRPITVTADPQSRFVSDPNPALTYTISGSGLANGDVLPGELATTATATSAIGNYPITQGSLSASSNYALNFVPGTLTVNACTVSAGCNAAATVQITTQIATAVQPLPPLAEQTVQQQQQQEQQQEQEKKETAEAESTGKPAVIVQTVINSGKINQPDPVNEQVTGSGNTTMWGGQ